MVKGLLQQGMAGTKGDSMKVILLQKRVGHEPEQWEDLKLPPLGERTLDQIMYKFRELKQEGMYRAVESGCGDGTPVIHTFHIYRREVYEVQLDGMQQ